MIWIRLGSLVMLLGMALGAFGAHALKGLLTPLTLAARSLSIPLIF